MVFGLGGFINAVFAKNFDHISWFPTFILTPLTYFGGVFYSIDLLPDWARVILLTRTPFYMVNAFRYGFLGVSDVDIRLAFGLMIAFTLALFAIAVGLMHKGIGIRE
jgi:ABC-2 type transport system permease protein